jgi:glutathione S-transferase
LSYKVRIFTRGKDMLAPKELKEIHPLGKSPVVGIKTPEMEKEMIMAESGVIVEYLLDHFGPEFIPPRYPAGKEGKIGGETESYQRYKYYLQYTEGSLMLYLVMSLVVGSKWSTLPSTAPQAKLEQISGMLPCHSSSSQSPKASPTRSIAPSLART